MNTSYDLIEIGDRVTVYLSKMAFEGTVRDILANGCWLIEDSRNSIHYVKDFEQIVKEGN
jgi:hypothetical protein